MHKIPLEDNGSLYSGKLEKNKEKLKKVYKALELL